MLASPPEPCGILKKVPPIRNWKQDVFRGGFGPKKFKRIKNGKVPHLQKLRSARDKEMKSVLTEEQYAIYKENQKEQRENFRERNNR